jgi:hypothetical protein
VRQSISLSSTVIKPIIASIEPEKEVARLFDQELFDDAMQAEKDPNYHPVVLSICS